MVNFMNMKKRMKISKGGQVSIPAPIRKRWGTTTLEDRGDEIVFKPAPDDPIEAAAGALADEFGHIDLVELRRIAREDDRIAMERRERREFPWLS
jgi:bifunctional DNA-binding transcriptional regulator/antitoxin component of YhaV-PrlF toxin-antitoxin module